ncbi:hypothetical protein SSP35_01_05310 [Streptomyces sp. NBRC 110611]|nr:hypothetical protein SSP35_01_05310 [Streptomyces sp. NBRC 110611]
MVPLGLQLRDHHDRQHDLVLVEAGHGSWIRQQHTGVEDIRTPVAITALLAVHHGWTNPLG